MNIDVATDQPSQFEPTTNGQALEQANRLRMPSATQSDESWYWGALVDNESPGVSHNVIYADLKSMYPLLLYTLNISKETLIGEQDRLDESQYTEDDCLWGIIDERPVKRIESHETTSDFSDPEKYKAVLKWSDSSETYDKKWEDPTGPNEDRCYYLKKSIREGIVPSMVDEWMEIKDNAKGTEKYDAVKAQINSLYGTLGWNTQYNAFRLFDHRLSESITIMGRLMIVFTKDFIIDYIRSNTGRDAYLTHMDTDGAGIAQPGAESRQEAMRTVQEAMDQLNESAYREWFEDTCGLSEDDELWAKVEMEYFAPSIYVHDSKKRYCTNMSWEEGDEVDEIEITGFEAIRSDTSTVTQEAMRTVLKTIVTHSKKEAKEILYPKCREWKTAVLEEIPIEELGQSGGIQQELESYGGDRKPSPIVRGAKYSRDYISGEESLGEGSKPMKYPVESIIDDSLPQTYDAKTPEDGEIVDYVSVENPENLQGAVEVDRTEILQKQLIDRINPIFANIGWDWGDAIAGTEDASIEDYL